MTYDQIYYYFPYFVFFYGSLLFFTVSSHRLKQIAEGLSHNIWPYLESHRPVGAVSVIVGGLWILQRLWLAS